MYQEGEVMTVCDCGLHVRGFRGLMAHFDRGCPKAVYELHVEGVDSEDLQRRFRLTAKQVAARIKFWSVVRHKHNA